jgi:hypothetical protein
MLPTRAGSVNGQTLSSDRHSLGGNHRLTIEPGKPSALCIADVKPRPAVATSGHPHQVEQFPSQLLQVALQGRFDVSCWLSRGIRYQV